MRRRPLVWILLLCGATSVALAHGGLPGTTQVMEDGDHLFVATRGSGMFVGNEGGAWHWICDEAINRRADRVFARTGSGVLLVTDFFGVQRSTDGGCSWERA